MFDCAKEGEEEESVEFQDNDDMDSSMYAKKRKKRHRDNCQPWIGTGYSEDDTKRLIAREVHRNVFIWMENHSDFKNTYKKAIAFEKIAQAIKSETGIEMSGHFVANEWATLRKYYKQNIRGKSRGGDRSESGIVKSKWKFYKDLMFLEESATAEPSLLLTDIVNSTLREDHVDSQRSPSAQSSSSSQESVERKQKSIDSVSLAIMSTLKEQISANKNDTGVASSFTSYVGQILSVVEDRNPRLAIQMKQEVLTICSKYEMLTLDE